MPINTTIGVTNMKVDLTVADGTGGTPKARVTDVVLWWDPDVLSIKSVFTSGFDVLSPGVGVIAWYKDDIPPTSAGKTFSVEFECAGTGTSTVFGTATDAKNGEFGEDHYSISCTQAPAALNVVRKKASTRRKNTTRKKTSTRKKTKKKSGRR